MWAAVVLACAPVAANGGAAAGREGKRPEEQATEQTKAQPAARARELWSNGERGEAVKVLEAALAAAPGEEALRRQLSEALMALHRYAAALECAKGLGREGAALRGAALFKLGRHAEALEELPREDEASLRLRIDAAEALGRFGESDSALEEWLARVGAEHADAARLRGLRAAREGRHEEAAAQFELALKRDPCDAAALFGLGQALKRLGRTQRALEVLAEHRRITPLLDQLDFAERAVDLDPRHGSNWAAVGDAQRALGRVELARAAYGRAAQLATEDEVVAIALRHARLEAEEARDVAAALAVLEAAGARKSDARLWVRAGDLVLERGERERARGYFERALALRPDDAQIVKRLEAARGS